MNRKLPSETPTETRISDQSAEQIRPNFGVAGRFMTNSDLNKRRSTDAFLAPDGIHSGATRSDSRANPEISARSQQRRCWELGARPRPAHRHNEHGRGGACPYLIILIS